MGIETKIIIVKKIEEINLVIGIIYKIDEVNLNTIQINIWVYVISEIIRVQWNNKKKSVYRILQPVIHSSKRGELSNYL